MHPAEIQALLKKRGIKQADIARECEVSRTIVGDVIQARRRSKQVEQRISELTELPPSKLWPQWYGAGTWWANQHELVTRDEALLLRSYRALSMDERAKVLARVQAMEAGFDDLAAREERTKVTGDKNRVAGRDYHEGATGKSKK